jgi:Nif-specific regulatory protein
VPLLLNRRATGLLCLELRFKPERDYERTAKFFGVVASMIAHAVKVQKLLEADRERLVQENVRLQGELRERYDFSHILGTSRAMHAVCEQMAHVARTNTTGLDPRRIGDRARSSSPTRSTTTRSARRSRSSR